jgi:uncharacterized protein YjiS (DUF1127 family)
MLPMNILRLHQAVAAPGCPRRWDRAIVRPGRGLIDAVLRVLRRWRERERLRRELAGMRDRDFGDLVIPPGLIEDERRRSPWQEWSSEWSTIASRRKTLDRIKGA